MCGVFYPRCCRERGGPSAAYDTGIPHVLRACATAAPRRRPVTGERSTRAALPRQTARRHYVTPHHKCSQ